MYNRIRTSNLSLSETCYQYRRERDHLFKCHPQSALDDDQKSKFNGINYYPYDPALRFVLPIDKSDLDPEILEVRLCEDGAVKLKRFGKIHFEIGGQQCTLTLFWITGYGGGVFLPFRDLTSGETTYGAGRYVLDTIKHADLGQEDGKFIIDFNYAYNPSCCYNSRWTCPLAPFENRLEVEIPVGEKNFDDDH